MSKANERQKSRRYSVILKRRDFRLLRFHDRDTTLIPETVLPNEFVRASGALTIHSFLLCFERRIANRAEEFILEVLPITVLIGYSNVGVHVCSDQSKGREEGYEPSFLLFFCLHSFPFKLNHQGRKSDSFLSETGFLP
jgi:hypothetical protein